MLARIAQPADILRDSSLQTDRVLLHLIIMQHGLLATCDAMPLTEQPHASEALMWFNAAGPVPTSTT